MFKISEFSKLSQVPAKTLRFYDQIDLLKPAYTDQQSGYRYYKSEQLLDLHRILAFKDLGFTLEQIKQLLNDNVSTAEIRGMLRLKQAELHSLIQSEMERLRRIEVRLEQIERKSDSLSHCEVVVKKVEPLMVATLKETTSRANIPGLFEEIDEYLKWNGIPLPVPHIVMWHGCPECESSIDLEIACPIPRKLQDTARFRTMELPELTVAAVTHISRPDMDTPVSIDLGSWIEENGYQISPEMPSREIYLSPQEGNKLWYVTESQMPILRAGFMQ
ncbi:MerR family transcriptional regulator [Brevibacillus aydinogluensis]|jgi:DNA-binding transcriptional MerR regulator|uniref:MerR family transcriptional regulator n=2 Tax=Brevibacillus TaxID=55080 RepID=A0AA48M898_9BACL|nr:MerR family transcriptional regulator [Brevibacillus aydinogluensis]CAJ1001391.1 MerR family transcriptional regulator [Brevibacillus aydinogluensis]